MNENKVCDELLNIFQRSRCHPLILNDIVELMRRREFFADMPFSKAAAKINSALCLERNDSKYPFLEFHINDQTLWGLSTWLPPKPPPSHKPREMRTPMHVGTEIEHKISLTEDLTHGYFPLNKTA